MSQPIYLRVGNWLKQFPQSIATGAPDAPTVSGPAAAALLSAAFSCFLLMVNQHLTVVFKSWNAIVWSLGDWIPGSRTSDQVYGEIGSYSGKETIMLMGWLLSWVLLHQLWKKTQYSCQQSIWQSNLFSSGGHRDELAPDISVFTPHAPLITIFEVQNHANSDKDTYPSSNNPGHA